MSDQLSQDLASLKIDRSPKAKGRSMFGLLVVLLLLGGAGTAIYLFVIPQVKSKFVTESVRTGEVTVVSPAQGQVNLTATGYVVALVKAKVAAKVPGRIAELFVDEGSVIQKGDKVARLEDVDHKSAISSARARAASARARVQIAKANVVELETTIKRDKPLADRGVIAATSVQDMEGRIGSLQASVKAAEAEAAAADAEARSLEVQLGSYLIVSPVAGTVVAKLVEVGEGVSPGFGTPGVVEVVDMQSLVVEVDVPENKLDQIAEGNPAEIVLDAYSTKRWGGKVKEVGRRVNRAKATVAVKVAFEDRPEHVLPEMAARVMFLAKPVSAEERKAPPKLIVPANAVVRRGGSDVIFVFDDDRVRQTTVKVGAPFAGGTELETPIPAGTKVVLDPPADMVDGKKVKEKT